MAISKELQKKIDQSIKLLKAACKGKLFAEKIDVKKFLEEYFKIEL